MKKQLEQLVTTALESIPGAIDAGRRVEIDRTRDLQHGHFSCNIAMQLSKALKKSPRDIAAAVVDALPESELIAGVDIAGPGFINFRLAAAAFHAELQTILDSAEDYGRGDTGSGIKVLLEFVSANPTGPLHVGHGRHAAYGACLANLYKAAGHEVHSEYYVNDAGRQMDILALSGWLRWLQASNEGLDFPAGAYQGEYVREIAAEISELETPPAQQLPEGLLDKLPDDKDAELDALIDRMRDALGEPGFEGMHKHMLDAVLEDIRDDLAEFGVHYDEWFSERSLTASGDVQDALDLLAKNNVTYEKDGAVWFRATDYGDEKDRVVVRDNGRTTYFASDIAYHLNKRRRGFHRLVNVWGADHHGYVPRVEAGMTAMGEDKDSMHVELVQFVALYRGGEKAQMSTRSGEFVTLRQLREEVGNDAARLFFVMRSNEQHLDFDLDLAKSESSDNPVYYLQYAHARVCSVMRQLEERSLSWDAKAAVSCLDKLVESQEEQLMLTLSKFPETVNAAAVQNAPQHVVHYLKDVAQEFHAYYNSHKFIVDDADIRNARLMLVLAIRQVMQNGLRLLGVSAPEHM
jgi:arginyl-tRNA synthetase